MTQIGRVHHELLILVVIVHYVQVGSNCHYATIEKECIGRRGVLWHDDDWRIYGHIEFYAIQKRERIRLSLVCGQSEMM